MNLRHLLLLSFLVTHFISHAQEPFYNQRPDYLKANSVWAFGHNAGLDFNNGGPNAFSTKMHADEGCASVAHSITGKLLFYSNGGQVWNANHQIMPNGRGLEGNGDYGRKGQNRKNPYDSVFYSTLQGVCIVPVINDPDKYYLFSLSGLTSGGPDSMGTLFYNVIDMKLNNGLGDVEANMKNIPLDRDTLSEGMLAIPGDNCDVWLIVHHQNRSEFKAYHITQDGIDTVPVISNTSDGLMGSYFFSALSVSPDREKIAIAYPGLGASLAKFDPVTGNVSEVMNIAFRIGGSVGICFSPDNSKLYVNGPANVHQFDLSVYDSTSIVNSQTLIASGSFGFFQSMGILRLYNDTIYLGGGNSLCRINQPNLLGTACDFQRDFITLLPGDTSYGHFNNDVVFPLPLDTLFTSLVLDTVVCNFNDIFLNISEDILVYEWEDGSNTSTRHIKDPGVYWVLYNELNSCYLKVDTFIFSYLSLEPMINVNEKVLGTTMPYDTYQWMLDGSIIPGAINSTYTVPVNGDYRVIVSDTTFGCIDTSEIYVVTNVGEANINSNDFSDQIYIYPNPANDMIYVNSPVDVHVIISSIEGRNVLHIENAKEISLDNLGKGIYILRMTDKQGNVLKHEKLVKNK